MKFAYKIFKTISLFCFVAILAISCSKDAPAPVVVQDDGRDFTLDQNMLDFGTTEVMKTVAVKFAKPEMTFGWKVEKNPNNKWIEFNKQGGNTEQTVDISINRNRIDFGDNYDTIYFHIYPVLTEAQKSSGIVAIDSIKKVIVKATRLPNFQEVLSMQVANGSKFIKNYIDPTYSITNSICVEFEKSLDEKFHDIPAQNFMNCVMYSQENVNGVPFSNNGNISVMLKAGGTMINIPSMQFNYYNSTGGMATGNIYKSVMPIDVAEFNNTTNHIYQFAAYSDTIKSVKAITLTPEPKIFTTSAVQDFIWESTPDTDDSVVVIMQSLQDSTFRFQSAVTDDNAKNLKFTGLQTAQVKRGGSFGLLTVIRFRYKMDANHKRYIISQSQKSYMVLLA